MLDVGCDDGHFLSQQVGRLKVGVVDLRPRVLSNGGLSVVKADGCVLPFADKSLSSVLAFDIIEHVVDDDAFIASLTRVRVNLWSAPSFRFLYVLLRALSSLSPALARFGAHLCFEMDRRLPKGRDHIFLEIVRRNRSGEHLT